jgi:phage protein D
MPEIERITLADEIARMAPSWEIRLGGTPGRDLLSYGSGPDQCNVQSIRVQMQDRAAARCVIQCFDRDWVLNNNIPRPSETKTEVNVWLGYSGQNKKCFKGLLDVLEPGHPAIETCTLSCLDRGLAMRKEQKRKDWKKYSILQIVDSICSDYDLTPDIDSTFTDTTEWEVQGASGGECDWDFIKRLAKRMGVSLWVSGDTLYFKQPEIVRTNLTFRRNHEIANFRPKDQRPHWRKTGRRKTQRPGTGNIDKDGKDLWNKGKNLDETKTDDGKRITRKQPIGGRPKDDPNIPAAQKDKLWAGRKEGKGGGKEVKGKARRSYSHVQEATLELQFGVPELDNRQEIWVNGFGDRWDGPWSVKGTMHEWAKGPTRTTLQIYRGRAF